MKKLLFILSISVVLFSCSKDEINISSKKGSLIVNAGNKTYSYTIDSRQSITLSRSFNYYQISAVNDITKINFMLQGMTSLSTNNMNGIIIESPTNINPQTLFTDDNVNMTFTKDGQYASGSFKGKIMSGTFTNIPVNF